MAKPATSVRRRVGVSRGRQNQPKPVLASPVPSPSQRPQRPGNTMSALTPSVRWRNGPIRLLPMTAEELLASLLASGSARSVPTAPPLTGGALLAGIEIVTTTATAEGPLRRAWRDRHGGGATPVLLLANDPARPGSVLALGVTRGDGAVRSVEASTLADVALRIAGRPRLDAVRELASELERLDLAGIPGLALRGLLTMHTLDVRLRGDASRWGDALDMTKALSRTDDWREVLAGLGYELERRGQRGFLGALRRPTRDGRAPQGRPVRVRAA